MILMNLHPTGRKAPAVLHPQTSDVIMGNTEIKKYFRQSEVSKVKLLLF